MPGRSNSYLDFCNCCTGKILGLTWLGTTSHRCSCVDLLEVPHIGVAFIHGGLLCVFGVLLC
jgi:hypothetical protein